MRKPMGVVCAFVAGEPENWQGIERNEKIQKLRIVTQLDTICQ